MKDNYIGNIIIAFALGTLVFFAGAHACQSFPFLAEWVGGECWLDTKNDDLKLASDTPSSSVMAAQKIFLEAQALHTSSKDDEIIKAAIYALAQSGSEDAVATLKEIALTHESTEIRKAALYALARCESDEALIPFYLTLAEQGDRLSVRKAAIYAIGNVGNQEAVEALSALATSSYHVSIRKAAVHALQNCDSDAAQKALYGILAKVTK